MRGMWCDRWTIWLGDENFLKAIQPRSNRSSKPCLTSCCWMSSRWDVLVQQNDHSKIRGELMWTSGLCLTFNQSCVCLITGCRGAYKHWSLGMIKLASTLPPVVISFIPSSFSSTPQCQVHGEKKKLCCNILHLQERPSLHHFHGMFSVNL